MFTSLLGNHLNSALHALDTYNCPLLLWMMLKRIYWSTYSARLVGSLLLKKKEVTVCHFLT